MEESALDTQERSSGHHLAKEEASTAAPFVGGRESSDNREEACPGMAGRGGEGEDDRSASENAKQDQGVGLEVTIDDRNTSESAEQDQGVRPERPLPSHLSGIHQLKWLPWKDSFLPIVTQNENGPCPLVALTNVLLLRGSMGITPGETVVTVQQLSDMLGACLLECTPADLDADKRSNYEQNLMDAMAVFPKLLTGLDINVKFDSVTGFEFTQELSIFDLLHVGLYHGWLADPSEPAYSVVAPCSYNQLVEMAVSDATSDDTNKVQNALLAQQFLEESASQLTYHGLYELNEHIREGELCIFFRNNHFNTLFKRNDRMLLLVTDLGFIKEYGHVWHILSDIDDSGDFLDATFHLLPISTPTATSSMPTSVVLAHNEASAETEVPSERRGVQDSTEECSTAHATSSQVTSSSGIALDVDHEIAMNLMHEQLLQAERDQAVQDSHSAPPPDQTSGHNLAQREALLGPPPNSRDDYEQAALAYGHRRQSRERSLCVIS